MKKHLLLFTLFAFACQSRISAQDNSFFDSYKAEADGYFNSFMETPFGIIATDNYASKIYLLSKGKYNVLFTAPGCGRYMNLSPDKKSIGFKYIQPDGQQAPALLNIENKSITLLNSPVDLCGQVSFSQNNKIAYTIGNNLVVKTGSAQNHYSLGQYVNIAPLSPDGNFVCYNDDYDQLFLRNLSNNQTIKITSGAKGNAYPLWSPDGSKLMYSSISGELYIYDMLSQTTTFIAEGHYPSWTDDSRYIVYTKLENTDLRLIGSDIYKARYDGSDIINLTNTPDNYEVAATPSGDAILYQSLNYKMVNRQMMGTNGPVENIFTIEGSLNLIQGGNIHKSMQSVTMIPGTVPYINQVYDTPEWHYGYGSCAPTSAIMVTAYYNKIPKWPITTSNGVGNHTSDYGAYVADKYRLNQYYYQDVSPTGGGEDAWGGYGYMWTGSYSPHSRMQQFISNHYITSVLDNTDNYSQALAQVNSGYPFPICNLLTSAGHLIVTVGYVNGQHTIIFNDPYGNKNNGSWPNWFGQNAHYDWPGYNNGNQNLNTVAWTVTAQGSEIAYNDTIIDDQFYNHGFYINNSHNGSIQSYYHDLSTGYQNHYWFTGTEAGSSDIAYVTWTPNLTNAGNYEIFAYIPGGSGCTATNAKYQVHHSNGISNAIINQTQNSGQWVSLGIYSLSAGQTCYVYLGDATGSSSQNIAFDAMKFHYTSPIDNTIPTTAITAPNNWIGSNFAATFTDADNNGGSGLEKSYYQVLDYDGTEWHANAANGFFADNFDSYNSLIWTVPSGSGTWQVTAGDLIQQDTSVNNTNIYAALNQNLSNRYLYQFYAKMEPATDGTSQHRFGLHFFSDNGALTNRGNSYFMYVRQETSTIELYKVINDAFTVVKTINNITTTFGQWYDYKIIFDRISGKVNIYRDNSLLGTWTDPNVLTTTGDFISFRTGNCKTHITELKVYRSRPASVTVNVGSAATNDIRYQNPGPAIYSGKIKSIVNDAAGNLSTIAFENINVDWTTPSCVTIADGISTDIDTTNSISSLSANWMASTDPHSGITKYWYAVGTSPGDTDVVSWTDNNLDTFFTASGLVLSLGQVYYISVKTEDGAGLNSVCSTDGILAEVNTGVGENENIITISAQPNPFNETATVYFSQKTDQKITLTLIDAVGKTVMKTIGNYSAGTHSINVNTDELGLAKGVYTLRVIANNSAGSLKLIKY